ncbi:endoribonuclease ysh-1 [Coniosporium apollinis CBS 100218]|uniref:Endoribonuclease ysh-1 n=1 Tax=Coniosporium apollinis (strain CBS 100218) TaxID=1168221 RepID=R7YJY4_CONA1|nr:endoribonuclease ysh-1 [Coniosporium apollinis CBS 100218]EON62210.1 endoribonuclease ysh-1 [Coniosporium apollinis CBS 100218]
MAAKRKLAAMGAVDEEPVDPADELMFLCLGGGNEVGRSCHVIQYRGKTVMLDAGMHPAYDGLAALPFYDEFDLSTVDVLLISHFHIDHAASLPYVLAKTNFKGRVFMTHPTKAIYKWLVQDSVRVGNISSSSESLNTTQPLYTESDHLSTFPMIEAIDYHTTHTISSIRITPYPAGHVLGAAMFLIEIAGLKILFTGDYSREEDRHLVSAEVPRNVKIDVLITESTYGIASHVPRPERETAFTKAVTSILNRGGRALLPVFALGRAQELLLILEEYWHKHPEYRKIPIYYASNLARKCMVVYQTYISAMNDNIRRLFRERMAEAEAAGSGATNAGPWDFRYVRSLKSLERFDDVGSCVMLASPGMMQNGVSRELLERWAPDPKNGVIITGYSVEGTMAKLIVQEPDTITAIMTRGQQGMRRGGEKEHAVIPRRCSVQEFSFAAHVDGTENREFIEEVQAPVVILVHGEKHNMMRLKSKLLSLNADKARPTKIFSPANCEELRIPFKADKIAKVVGKLAQIPPPLPHRSKDGQQQGAESDEQLEKRLITGVLVQNDFKMSLMAPEDLREYAGLTITTITCRQRLTLSAAGVDLIRWALEGTFGALKEASLKDKAVDGKAETNGHSHKAEDADEEIDRTTTAFTIMDCVTVRIRGRGEVEVEWEGNMINDGIADAVLAVLFTVESSPAAVKQSSRQHSHNHSHTPPPLPEKRKRNPHAAQSPETRFARLCMFLEAQFGPGITPITHPKLPVTVLPTPESSPSAQSLQAEGRSPQPEEKDDQTGDGSPAPPSEDQLSKAEQAELKRLHALGIPVPGVEIRVDKHVAKVWLETLEVECSWGVLRDRVRAVVERAVEVVAPVWG